jgi:hypothetical protein
MAILSPKKIIVGQPQLCRSGKLEQIEDDDEDDDDNDMMI